MRRSPYVVRQRAPMHSAQRPGWEREKYRLLVLYRTELYEYLTEGQPLPRMPHTRGKYRSSNSAAVA